MRVPLSPIKPAPHLQVTSRIKRAYPLLAVNHEQQEGLVSVVYPDTSALHQALYQDTRAVPSRKTTYGSAGRLSRARRTVSPVDERPEIFYVTRALEL